VKERLSSGKLINCFKERIRRRGKVKAKEGTISDSDQWLSGSGTMFIIDGREVT